MVRLTIGLPPPAATTTTTTTQGRGPMKTTIRRLLGAATLAILAGVGSSMVATATYAQTQEIALVDQFMAWNLDDYEAAGTKVPDFKQSPSFDDAVAAGTLPALADRLPARDDVMVVRPRESIGTYGGTIRYNATNPQSFGNVGYSAWDAHLAGVTTNWEIVYPDIARSIELAADNMSATVTLRKGMKWSDGQPVSADDILFFFNDIGGQGDLPPLPGNLIVGGKPIVVEKIDDQTVKFNFAAPNPAFILSVARADLRRAGPSVDSRCQQTAPLIRAYPKPLLRPCSPAYCDGLHGGRTPLRPGDPNQAAMALPIAGKNPGFLHDGNARSTPLGPETRAGAQLGRHVTPIGEREDHGVRPVLNGCLY